MVPSGTVFPLRFVPCPHPHMQPCQYQCAAVHTSTKYLWSFRVGPIDEVDIVTHPSASQPVYCDRRLPTSVMYKTDTSQWGSIQTRGAAFRTCLKPSLLQSCSVRHHIHMTALQPSSITSDSHCSCALSLVLSVLSCAQAQPVPDYYLPKLQSPGSSANYEPLCAPNEESTWRQKWHKSVLHDLAPRPRALLAAVKRNLTGKDMRLQTG